MYFIYSLIYLIVIALLSPYEFFRRPKGIRNRWIKERFGIIDKTSDKPLIWIHAVSVGEVNAIVPLVKRIQKELHNYHILLTTVTDTGQEVARRHFNSSVDITYIPFDLTFTIGKMIKRTKPELILIAETEIWPNLIRSAKKGSIPTMIINGRISERSFKGYLKIRFFMKDVLKNIDICLMQNDTYSKRIVELGAHSSKVKTMGNLKFDIEISEKALNWAERLKGRVIVAGSTHDPEEEIILKAFINIRDVFDDVRLIIAPRHPQRFKVVEDLLQRTRINFIKRSQISEDTVLTSFEIILLDVMGELTTLYKYCDLAILGGSFIPHGGQNPLEPAYWGKGIVCGPHMKNFYFIDDFIRANAVVMTDSHNLSQTLHELISNHTILQTMGKNAQMLIQSNRGAVERVLDSMKDILNTQIQR